MDLLINTFALLLAIFMALIAAYCIGRMLGLGIAKSIKDYLTPPIGTKSVTAKEKEA